MHRMENGKLAAFPALNFFVEEKILICAVFHESFMSTLMHLFLSWIDIFLFTIITKYLSGCEVHLKCQR